MLFARLQQRDELLVLTGLQVAVRQHQIRVSASGSDARTRLSCGMAWFGRAGLVVGQREIQARGAVARIGLQRRLVLRDRVVELSEPDVGGAEVRQRVGAIGSDGQRGLVGLDGAEHVAGLLQLERAREQPLEVLGGLSLGPHGRQRATGGSRGIIENLAICCRCCDCNRSAARRADTRASREEVAQKTRGREPLSSPPRPPSVRNTRSAGLQSRV